jgi:hypothetical protein
MIADGLWIDRRHRLPSPHQPRRRRAITSRFYSDKHSIFRVNNKDAIGGEGITQFGRALSELNIDIICANSPQAKGRVERAFGYAAGVCRRRDEPAGDTAVRRLRIGLRLFRTTRAYLEAHGKPVAFYSDKHNIFRVNNGEGGERVTPRQRVLHDQKKPFDVSGAWQSRHSVHRPAAMARSVSR